MNNKDKAPDALGLAPENKYTNKYVMIRAECDRGKKTSGQGMSQQSRVRTGAESLSGVQGRKSLDRV